MAGAPRHKQMTTNKMNVLLTMFGFLFSILFIWYGFNPMPFHVNLRGCFIMSYGVACVTMIVIAWAKPGNKILRVANILVFALGVIDILWLEDFNVKSIVHPGVDDMCLMFIAFPILLINWFAIERFSKRALPNKRSTGSLKRASDLRH